MDGYITNVWARFRHSDPAKPEHSPQKHRPITYGAKAQYSEDDHDTSPMLNAKGIKGVQAIIGSLLYYARVVNNKLHVALSVLETKQAKAIVATDQARVHLILDYVATYPNDSII